MQNDKKVSRKQISMCVDIKLHPSHVQVRLCASTNHCAMGGSKGTKVLPCSGALPLRTKTNNTMMPPTRPAPAMTTLTMVNTGTTRIVVVVVVETVIVVM